MYQYKDLGTLTKVVSVTLIIYMVARLLFMGANFWAHQTLDGTQDQLSAVYVMGITAIVFLVTLVGSVILVGRWIYRASANAHTLTDEMTISPGWAVGWYFVPFANLVKPFQAMREIWMASHFRGNWHSEPSPTLLTTWWALWIIVNVLDNISTRLDSRASDGTASAALMLDVFAALLNIGLCLNLITIMRRIAHAQTTAPYQETFA